MLPIHVQGRGPLHACRRDGADERALALLIPDERPLLPNRQPLVTHLEADLTIHDALARQPQWHEDRLRLGCDLGEQARLGLVQAGERQLWR